jgi:hypothetical protein
MGAVLLVLSCGGSGGKTGAAGSGGGQSGSSGGGQSGSSGGGQSGSSGGADGSIACGAVSACGGDIVGTWNVAGSCLTGTEDLGSVCAGATADIEFMFTGTTTFNADGSYTSTNGGGAVSNYHYPAACLTNGVTCDQFGQLLKGLGMYSSVTCVTDAAGVCNCAAQTAPVSGNETGTYTTSGGTLTTMHGGTTSMGPYCVQGNILREMPASGDGGVVVSGGIVLVKQ